MNYIQSIINILLMIGLALYLPIDAIYALTQSIPQGCHFYKPFNFSKPANYDLFGTTDFKTLVCGYIVVKKEQIFEQSVNIAYFRILRAQDPKFLQAIKRGVDEGNFVNFYQDNNYYLNLGCVNNQQILGDMESANNPYMTRLVQQKILKSSPKKPVSLILSFTKHDGSGCICCNLADQIRLY